MNGILFPYALFEIPKNSFYPNFSDGWWSYVNWKERYYRGWWENYKRFIKNFPLPSSCPSSEDEITRHPYLFLTVNAELIGLTMLTHSLGGFVESEALEIKKKFEKIKEKRLEVLKILSQEGINRKELYKTATGMFIYTTLSRAVPFYLSFPLHFSKILTALYVAPFTGFMKKSFFDQGFSFLKNKEQTDDFVKSVRRIKDTFKISRENVKNFLLDRELMSAVLVLRAFTDVDFISSYFTSEAMDEISEPNEFRIAGVWNWDDFFSYGERPVYDYNFQYKYFLDVFLSGGVYRFSYPVFKEILKRLSLSSDYKTIEKTVLQYLLGRKKFSVYDFNLFKSAFGGEPLEEEPQKLDRIETLLWYERNLRRLPEYVDLMKKGEKVWVCVEDMLEEFKWLHSNRLNCPLWSERKIEFVTKTMDFVRELGPEDEKTTTCAVEACDVVMCEIPKFKRNLNHNWAVKVRVDARFKKIWELLYEINVGEESFKSFFENYCLGADLLDKKVLDGIERGISSFFLYLDNPEEAYYRVAYFLNSCDRGKRGHVVESRIAFLTILTCLLMEKAKEAVLAGKISEDEFERIKGLVKKLVCCLPPHSCYTDLVVYHLFRRGLSSSREGESFFDDLKRCVELFKEVALLLAERASYVGTVFVCSYLIDTGKVLGERSVKDQIDLVVSLIKNKTIDNRILLEISTELPWCKKFLKESKDSPEKQACGNLLSTVPTIKEDFVITPTPEWGVYEGYDLKEIRERLSGIVESIKQKISETENQLSEDWVEVKTLELIASKYWIASDVSKALYEIALDLKEPVYRKLRKKLLGLAAYSARTFDVQEKLLEEDKEIRICLARNPFLVPHVLLKFLSEEKDREVLYELCFNNPLLVGTELNLLFFTLHGFNKTSDLTVNLLDKAKEKLQGFLGKAEKGDKSLKFLDVEFELPDEKWLDVLWRNERFLLSLHSFNLGTASGNFLGDLVLKFWSPFDGERKNVPQWIKKKANLVGYDQCFRVKDDSFVFDAYLAMAENRKRGFFNPDFEVTSLTDPDSRTVSSPEVFEVFKRFEKSRNYDLNSSCVADVDHWGRLSFKVKERIFESVKNSKEKLPEFLIFLYQDALRFFGSQLSNFTSEEFKKVAENLSILSELLGTKEVPDFLKEEEVRFLWKEGVTEELVEFFRKLGKSLYEYCLEKGCKLLPERRLFEKNLEKVLNVIESKSFLNNTIRKFDCLVGPYFYGITLSLGKKADKLIKVLLEDGVVHPEKHVLIDQLLSDPQKIVDGLYEDVSARVERANQNLAQFRWLVSEKFVFKEKSEKAEEVEENEKIRQTADIVEKEKLESFKKNRKKSLFRKIVEENDKNEKFEKVSNLTTNNKPRGGIDV